MSDLERPLGISLLIWLFWFWAGAIVLILLGFAIGEGPIMMAGSAVPRSEALGAVLPALVPMGFAVVGAALALALRRRWARPAALLPFALAAAAPELSGTYASAGELALESLAFLPVLGLVAWYLYGRGGARDYFAALRERAEAERAGGEPGAAGSEARAGEGNRE